MMNLSIIYISIIIFSPVTSLHGRVEAERRAEVSRISRVRLHGTNTRLYNINTQEPYI